MLFGVATLVAFLWFALDGYRLSVAPTGEIPRESSWARSTVMPDLMVSAIEIAPAVPVAGESFRLSVFCQNIGVVSAGRYGLRLTVTNDGGETLYTRTVAGNAALDPGETGSGFSSADMRLQKPGGYEVTVRIVPEGFEDAKPGNNGASRRFDVR